MNWSEKRAHGLIAKKITAHFIGARINTSRGQGEE